MTSSAKRWTETTLAGLMVDGVFADGDWIETKDQDENGNVRLTQLADIGVGHWRNRSNRRLTSASAKRLGCTFLERGDVLVARMPDPLGRACIFPGDSRPAITVVDVCILRPNRDDVDNKWLMWFFNAPQTRAKIEALQSGTTRKRISRKNLGGLQIALPPIEEQRRVVATIEKHLSHLDAADASLIKASARLDALRASAYESARIGGGTLVQLNDVVAQGRRIAYGVLQPGSDFAGGTPLVRVGDIYGGSIHSTDLKHIRPQIAAQFPRTQLRGGEVLLTIVGTIGRAAVVPSKLSGANVARAVAVIPIAEPMVSADFLAMVLNAPSSRIALERAAHEVARKTLNLEDVRRFEFILPPTRKEQDTIVERISAELARCDVIMRSIHAAQLRCARLRSSILSSLLGGKSDGAALEPIAMETVLA